jgi:tRNA pseudouridine38-40 synthase
MLNKSLVMTTKASLGQELLRKTARPGFNLYVLRTRPLRFVANRYVECNSIADATLGIGLPLARLHQICKDLQTVYMTRNLKLVLAYDGSEFSGWQVQPDAATIQGTLASAIGRVTGEKVLPQASGRTDAGVHALAQVVTLVTESPMPARNLVKALNDILPPAIRVIESADVPLEFHARKSAQAKTYRYRIYRGAICSPFLARYVWHYPFPLDENAMQRAASLVIGEHDFTSFAAVDSERSRKDETISDAGHGIVSNVRRIFASAWDIGSQEQELVYTVRGSGFLHHMVRNLVGTFVLVGKGTLKPDDITGILAARNRSAAGATAPASGLYLVSVEY